MSPTPLLPRSPRAYKEPCKAQVCVFSSAPGLEQLDSPAAQTSHLKGQCPPGPELLPVRDCPRDLITGLCWVCSLSSSDLERLLLDHPSNVLAGGPGARQESASAVPGGTPQCGAVLPTEPPDRTQVGPNRASTEGAGAGGNGRSAYLRWEA